MLKILFIGDVSGKIGRQAVKKLLPKIKKEYHPDIVIINAENSAHGSGVTESTIKELYDAGADFLTTGDHAFRGGKNYEIFDKYPLLRPANYADNVPGQGFCIWQKKGYNILLINLIGQVFMRESYNNPFHKLDEILANISLPRKNLSAILIDIHSECTSEKIALKHYADGRVSAIFGTHTHVMTADHQITPKGTAYITDTGMVGAADECIGVDKTNIIKTFLTQIKSQHVIPEKGRAILNSVLVEIDPSNGKAKSIKPITKFVEIK